MNKTNIEHMAFGAVLQFMIGFILLASLGYGWAFTLGGVAAGAVFFGREYAQVEYRIRERTGQTLTMLMPWHVLKPDEWTKDGLIDFVGVWVVCAVITAWAWKMEWIS